MIANGVTSAESAQAATAQPADQSAAAAAASDFDTFLQLLTAQLRNQDPLSPLDSTQFVEQLASFSAVEQQIETNNRLDELTSNLTASSLEGASSWIGRYVETQSGAARFAGETLSYRIPESSLGDASEALVSNADGDIVYRETLSAGQKEFTWDGRNEAGDMVSHGDYAVVVNYADGEEITDTKFPISIAAVTEARVVDASAKLVLSNGAMIDPEDIIAVRSAPEDNSESSSDILPGDA